MKTHQKKRSLNIKAIGGDRVFRSFVFLFYEDNLIGSVNRMSIRRMRSHTARCDLRVWDVFSTSKLLIFLK